MSTSNCQSPDSNPADESAESRLTRALPAFALTLICAAMLAACGGGSDGPSPESALATLHADAADDANDRVLPEQETQPLETGPTRPAAGPRSGRMPSVARFNAAELGKLTPAQPGALNMTDIRLAQSHVIPNGKRVWTQPELPKGSETLRLSTNRAALALVKLSAGDVQDPVLEVWDRGSLSDTIPLQPPSALPSTEDKGSRYGEFYSAQIPADYIWSGIELKVSARNYARGNSLPLDVSAENDEELVVLPMYLFGSTEANSGYSAAKYGTLTPDELREFNDRMPFDFRMRKNGPLKAEWDSFSIGPDGKRPAYVMRDFDDGDADFSHALRLLDGIRVANGEDLSPVTYYSPLLGLRSDGSLRLASGGKGWAGSAVGPYKFERVFIHELGHTFGMGHAGSSYKSGEYPYPNGSLLGSNWGWDATRSLFLAPWVPTSASNYKNCSGHIRDEQNRCVRQDIMEGGNSDQPSGVRFAMFSDFSAAVMQRRMEYDSVMPEGDEGQFVRFNSTTRAYEAFEATTSNSAYYGIAQNLPRKIKVPVYTLIAAISNTNPEINQFYAPLKYTGNLLWSIDPTDAADRAAIDPSGKGPYRYFCRRSGCDYSLRLTYADGSQRFQLLQGGFRAFASPSGPDDSTARDPLDEDSYLRWVVNVPGDKALRKLELIATPEGWKGVPAQPRVVMSRDL